MKKNLYTLLLSGLLLLSFSASAQLVITTYAGQGLTGGYSGDGGIATNAEMTSPTDIVFDTVGNLYIADFINNVIRKVDTNGIISTYAGTGFGAGGTATGGFSGDGGPATSANLNGPYALALDKLGNLFFADGYNHVVRKVTPAGIISTVAGNHLLAGYSGDGGPATSAQLNNPVGLAIDDTGNLYIADDHNNVIRKVSTAGIISTFAGDSTPGHAGNGGPATSALLNLPLGLAIDKKGNVFIADAQNNIIRKVDTAGIISDYAGYDTVHGYSGDGGLATAAKLAYPVHMTVDDSGNLYFGDSYNSVVRKINTAGIITTIAGNDTAGYAGDGGDPLMAQLNYPHSVAIDRHHHIYIADRGNDVIRKIAPPDLTNTNMLFARPELLRSYPNPAASGSFTLNLVSAYNEDAQITITNLMGETIQKLQIATNTPTAIKLDNPSGIYFVTAVTPHGSWNKKVILE